MLGAARWRRAQKPPQPPPGAGPGRAMPAPSWECAQLSRRTGVAEVHPCVSGRLRSEGGADAQRERCQCPRPVPCV